MLPASCRLLWKSRKLTIEQSEVSNLVEDATREMARSHINTRFIKLHYAEAEFEPAGVPALLAYRNGDKFAGFVPVSDEIPDNEELSAKTLTALLQRYVIPLVRSVDGYTNIGDIDTKSSERPFHRHPQYAFPLALFSWTTEHGKTRQGKGRDRICCA